MDLFIAIGFLLFVLWYWTLVRGRLTVRAYLFLCLLNESMTPQDANWIVMKIGFLDATDDARAAKHFVDEFFEGKQLSMIAYARSQGFLG